MEVSIAPLVKETRVSVNDFVVTSPDLGNGERIDDRFAGQEGAQTPRLSVEGVPSEAVELAVVCHDPDAPLPAGFTHWTLYGLPAKEGAIDASAGRPGPNDDDGMGYVGPFPPAGHGSTTTSSGSTR